MGSGDNGKPHKARTSEEDMGTDPRKEVERSYARPPSPSARKWTRVDVGESSFSSLMRPNGRDRQVDTYVRNKSDSGANVGETTWNWLLENDAAIFASYSMSSPMFNDFLVEMT